MLRIIGLITLATLCSAADSWDDVRTIKAGEKVRVVERSMRSRTGEFVRVDATGITFTVDGQESTVEQAEVARVAVHRPARRLRNALIGAAVGVGLGVAIDQSLGERLRNEGSEQRALIYVGSIGAGAGIGAAVGTWSNLYRQR